MPLSINASTLPPCWCRASFMHPTCVEGSLAHAACVACTVAGCVIVPNVRRNSSGPCARAVDALPNRQRSANDPPRGGTVIPPDRAALLLLQASERFSMERGIVVADTKPGALNPFGLISQLGPDQCHRNQQRLHPLITRHFRACEAVRSLLSALAYNGKAVHGPREDVTRQVGRQAAGTRPGASCG